jgi:hypothetical protein
MKTILNLNVVDILYIIAAIFTLLGTLMIMHGDKKKVKTITETPVDTFGPLLFKDFHINPSVIAKRHLYDPHNKKMERIRLIGIIFLVSATISIIFAIILPKLNL